MEKYYQEQSMFCKKTEKKQAQSYVLLLDNSWHWSRKMLPICNK